MNARCSVEGVEDTPLVSGRGCFADDMGERPGTAHAAVLRTPHVHAEIVSIDATVARSMSEIVAVLTGEDIAAWSRPFIAGVKQPMRHHVLAVDRVRYVGEPVAVVVARNRYAAEDALEGIEVEYRERDPVVDPAAAPGAPLLHPEVGSNVVSDRHFLYGDPDTAFATADHRIGISVNYPRNACTPIEGFVVVAEYLGEDGYDVFSNFQGPYSLHPVMARALGVPGSRLRLRSPPGLRRQLRRQAGHLPLHRRDVPRLPKGRVPGQVGGRPPRAPRRRDIRHEPGNDPRSSRHQRRHRHRLALGPARRLRCVPARPRAGVALPNPRPHDRPVPESPTSQFRNRVVLTNKTPTGLNRGFGGPQVYFALERLMHRIAKTLGLDPLNVIRRNLVPKESFPYRAPAGSLLDSGDYATALDIATGDGRLARLRARRDSARAEGRRYGHRIRRCRRAQHLQHGLHHHGPHRGRTGAGRSQGRLRGVRHRGHRPHRLDHRAGRFRAAGPGPPHRARPRSSPTCLE